MDHASLNQIVASLKEQLAAIEAERNVTFEILDDNANADGSVMQQIISNFIAEDVDLMVGVATPVAMTMQGMTEDNGIPVVFAAVSDPLAVSLVESLEAPGANITGTSDYLNTDAIIELIFAANPDAKNIALLYDLGQDASTTPIAAAKALLDAKGVSYREYNGSNSSLYRRGLLRPERRFPGLRRGLRGAGQGNGQHGGRDSGGRRGSRRDSRKDL